jgi:hypothetical protein
VLRKGVCLLVALVAGTGATAALATPAAAAGDVDLFLFKAGVTHDPPSLLSATQVSYSFINGGCVDVSLPPPAGVTLPTYVDLPEGETGVCPSVTGGGDLFAQCSTGMIRANWTLTEPDSDNAVFAGEGVIINGIAIVAGTPSSELPGLGYVDPGSPAAGSAVAVAAFLPEAGAICGGNGGDIMKNVVAALAAY